MTQDERNMLNDLANKIAQTPAPPKDAEAEEFIRTRIGSRPDALYLMTQTVLIQNLALQQAQQQLQELQQRVGQPAPSGSAGSGSFLHGQNPPRPAGSSNQAVPGPQYSQPQYAPPQPQYAASAPSGAPSFLRGAAQTAAGVAAGALAFEGIRSLFSHPGYGGGFGGFGGAGFGGPGVEETVVNNYYDDARDDRSDFGSADDSGQYDDSGQDDSGQYDDSSDFGGGDDGGGFDGGGDNFA